MNWRIQAEDNASGSACRHNANAQIIVYPNAGHAFHADYRPSFDAESAQDGWQRMLAWFKQYTVG